MKIECDDALMVPNECDRALKYANEISKVETICYLRLDDPNPSDPEK